MKVLKSADREKLLFQQRQGLLEQIKLKEKNQQKLLENEVEILALEKNKQEREDFFRLDRALESYMKIQKAVLNDRIRLENERRRDVLKKTGKSTSEAQKKRNEENRRKYELGGAINNMQDIIVKDNALINASYNLDLVEQRLILLAIVEARESGKGITANDPLEVHAESYINQFNVARQTAYQALKDACKDLFARQFSYQEINKRGKVEHVLSRWVSEIRYIDDEATVKLIFSPSIVPLITRLEEQFTKYELQQISKLTSAYAVRLYELLIAWRSSGQTPIIELADFRKKIGVLDDEYVRMGNFKDRVLNLAISQINLHTDIKVKCEQHKKEAIRVFGEPIKKGNVKEDVKIDKIESAEVLLLRQQVDMLKNQLDDAKGRESFYQNQIETMQRLLEAPKDKEELLLQPDKGALIKNGGGIRKIRCSQSNKGKSGGIRINKLIFYDSWLRNNFMENNLFDDLVASIKEAGAIKRQEIKASRVIKLELPDIKQPSHTAKLGARKKISNRTSSDFN
ncbi:PREDICTED: uncharacterized protein LOC108578264 [Habropoda laboriosa]|uniref:uncharacterized protein LOC108578264 n=1 Tax=Habropoda laboriosa TaxID=597456 RepID=UPI00083E3083|nr:PREDICTED: uncharacterized protein LOC108578264 [Habropoda laboriosa]